MHRKRLQHRSQGVRGILNPHDPAAAAERQAHDDLTKLLVLIFCEHRLSKRIGRRANDSLGSCSRAVPDQAPVVTEKQYAGKCGRVPEDSTGLLRTYLQLAAGVGRCLTK